MSMGRVRAAGVDRSPITVGAVAGLIAGVPMGLLLQFGTELVPILGAIVGYESLVVGWIVHLVASTVFGAIFGWMVTLPVFRTLTDTVAECILLGVVHATALAFVMIGIVIPGLVEFLSVSGEGIPLTRVPGPSGGSLLSAGVFGFAHLVYGVVLGAGYALIEDVSEEPEPRGPDGDRGPSDSR